MDRQNNKLPDPLRSGIITANGVLLGFALAFFTRWSMGPDEWGYIHIPSLVFFFAGVSLLINALFRSLNPDDLSKEYFKTTINRIIWGVAFFFGGIFISIALEYLRLHFA